MELESVKLTTLSHFVILTRETRCFPISIFFWSKLSRKKLNMFQAGVVQIHLTAGII